MNKKDTTKHLPLTNKGNKRADEKEMQMSPLASKIKTIAEEMKNSNISVNKLHAQLNSTQDGVRMKVLQVQKSVYHVPVPQQSHPDDGSK
jgi:hypothetical protein